MKVEGTINPESITFGKKEITFSMFEAESKDLYFVSVEKRLTSSKILTKLVSAQARPRSRAPHVRVVSKGVSFRDTSKHLKATSVKFAAT